jgi:hypothetical protein
MIALIVVALVVAAAIAWNTVPVLRKKLQGWSTLLETALGGLLYAAGVVGDAIQEAQKLGYIPSEWVGYIPYVLMAYLLIKRMQTKTPVGGRK